MGGAEVRGVIINEASIEEQIEVREVCCFFLFRKWKSLMKINQIGSLWVSEQFWCRIEWYEICNR